MSKQTPEYLEYLQDLGPEPSEMEAEKMEREWKKWCETTQTRQISRVPVWQLHEPLHLERMRRRLLALQREQEK